MTRPPFVSWSDSIHIAVWRDFDDLEGILGVSVWRGVFGCHRNSKNPSCWRSSNRQGEADFGRKVDEMIKTVLVLGGDFSTLFLTGGFLNTMRVLLFGQDFQFDYTIFWDGLKPPSSVYITYYLHMGQSYGHYIYNPLFIIYDTKHDC